MTAPEPTPAPLVELKIGSTQLVVCATCSALVRRADYPAHEAFHADRARAREGVAERMQQHLAAYHWRDR